MVNNYTLIFLVSVFISSCAQIILKISAKRVYCTRLQEYLNPYVIMAYSILLVSTILTIIAYREVELKIGPVLESSGYIYVLILSWVFFGERISFHKVGGIVLIISGIYICFI